jgi:hypothetical protein
LGALCGIGTTLFIGTVTLKGVLDALCCPWQGGTVRIVAVENIPYGEVSLSLFTPTTPALIATGRCCGNIRFPAGGTADLFIQYIQIPAE